MALKFQQSLSELAKRLLTTGPIKTCPTSRRVRVLFNHTYIVDTTNALHVWEHEGYPQFYIPISDLKNYKWSPLELIPSEDGKSRATIMKLTVQGPDKQEKSTDRAIFFSDGPAPENLTGLVRLEFAAMDKWLEEDVPIYVHPKDPFKRIDILASTRPVEVKVAGHTVASSPVSTHLLETSLPTRYYLPLSAVDQAMLRPSDLITKCPYKGEAEYYDVVVGGETYKNLVWYYRLPTAESAPIAGLVCFYNEKVDIYLDGKLLERPMTHFA